MSSLLGTTLSGRYTLQERIGSGGMSTVYRAVDETLQRDVAVKVMNREVASDSDQLERFRREARAVAQLSHPHVVGVIDYGEDDGRPYIVFEYVEGETLKERIRRSNRLPIPEAIAYTIEIARALGAAHTRHIVHRDVKPQNVLIDHEGTAKVTDFGIARTLDEEGLTADGRVIGTTDYVSPEQALGEHVTPCSDIYSLGIVLYEMLTGDVPYQGDNQVAVAMKHVHEPLPDVRKLRPEVSVALAAVVDRATSKDPRNRYANDREMIAELEDVLTMETSRAGQATGETTSVLKTLPAQKRRRVPVSLRYRPWMAALAAIIVIIAAGIGIWLGSRTHNGNAPSKTGQNHGSSRPTPVKLCSSCATAYNPDGLDGDTTQNNAQAPAAIDGNASTAWGTEIYYDNNLDKPGVGLYVDTRTPVVASRITLVTSTPHFSVQIYGTNKKPDPSSFAASGWHRLGAAADVVSPQRISLAGTTKYRYFLVWITKLPPGASSASISEIRLDS